MNIEEILIACQVERDGYEIELKDFGRSLTFWTIASEVTGECHVPYGAAFGPIVDKVRERRATAQPRNDVIQLD